MPPEPAEDAGIFALADPDALRTAYLQVGFREVTVQVGPVLRRFSSVAAAVQYRLESMCPEVASLMADLGDDGHDAVNAEIEEVVGRFADRDGVSVPAAPLGQDTTHWPDGPVISVTLGVVLPRRGCSEPPGEVARMRKRS